MSQSPLTKQTVHLFFVLIFASCSGSLSSLSGDEERRSRETENQTGPGGIGFEDAKCSVGEHRGWQIINGSTVHDDAPVAKSVVLLLVYLKNDKVSLCTATLIRSDVLITASHCLLAYNENPNSPDYPEHGEAVFSANPTCMGKSQSLRRISFKKVILNEKYRGNFDQSDKESVRAAVSNDIALIQLQSSAPANYIPMEFATLDPSIQSRDFVHIAGFGTTQPDGSKSETAIRLRVKTLSAANPDDSSKSAFQMSGLGTITLSQKTGGVCSGDSGGPLIFVKGHRSLLVGITSMGQKVNGSQLCEGYSMFSDVFSQSEWILAHLAKLSH